MQSCGRPVVPSDEDDASVGREAVDDRLPLRSEVVADDGVGNPQRVHSLMWSSERLIDR
jgi:hypothetical protein